ncbi:MAG: glycosyltransferase family 4 protein [Cryomorphaceae bacterium]
MRERDLTVLLATDGIPPYVMGGMQKHSRFVAEYLAMNEVNVICYHYVQGQNVTNEEVALMFSPKARERIKIRTFSYPKEDAFPGHYLRAQKKVSALYLEAFQNEKGVDFIFCKGFMAWAFVTSSSKGKVPVGVKFHGMNMFQKQPNFKGELVKFLMRPPVRRLMNMSDFVFSYGGKISDIIREEIREGDKLIEIQSGIEDSWIKEEPNKFHAPLKFILVGRHDRLKGLPELYKAISQLPDSTSGSWELTIVGPIPRKHQYDHPHIMYAGPISNEDDLMRLYDRCDVLLCPSISEGMPNVILEAMARGLAVLSTDVGASGLLVNEKNGWLVPPGNSTELCNGLLEVLALTPDQLYTKKCASIQIINGHFRWELIGKRLKKEILLRV